MSVEFDSDKRESSVWNGVETLNCPYCDLAMKDGFLNTKGGLIFSQNKWLAAELPHRNKDDVTFMPFTRCSYNAWFCDKCGCCIIRKKKST